MKKKLGKSILLAFCAGFGLSDASAEACASRELLELVRDHNVYLGEIHGTVEAPALVRCLVDEVVGSGAAVHLSLELPEYASELDSDFWSIRDGRASVAMRDLLEYALGLEREAKVSVHYQQRGIARGVDMDRWMGEGIAQLAGKGRVIALSGNYHARRTQQNQHGNKARSAGDYLDGTFRNVALFPVNAGSAWTCTAGECRERPVGASRTPREVGSLVDGSGMGYDFFYYVDVFTASPPAILVDAGGSGVE